MKTIELVCETCHKTFTRKLSVHKHHSKEGCTHIFCSHKCSNSKTRQIQTHCKECGSTIFKKPYEIRTSKSRHVFCNRSCATSYNNKHKIIGVRRSKLESYLEEKIKIDFPNLVLQINDKTAIGSEIDLYLPELNLGVEINGIFHYKPIFGEKKLQKIQKNDANKQCLCKKNNITLVVIEVLEDNMTNKVMDKYWVYLKNILSKAG